MIALLEQFKVQRMLSPAETDLLQISVSGCCDAPQFVQEWRALVAKDQIAAAFMQRMSRADLACTDAESVHALIAAPQT